MATSDYCVRGIRWVVVRLWFAVCVVLAFSLVTSFGEAALIVDEMVVPGEGMPPRIPGDANGDGRVDDLDAKILAKYWGKTAATWEMGDFDDDTRVGPMDAAILAANWGFVAIPAPPDPTHAPEPTTLVIWSALGLLGAALVRWRPRR